MYKRLQHVININKKVIQQHIKILSFVNVYIYIIISY